MYSGFSRARICIVFSIPPFIPTHRIRCTLRSPRQRDDSKGGAAAACCCCCYGIVFSFFLLFFFRLLSMKTYAHHLAVLFNARARVGFNATARREMNLRRIKKQQQNTVSHVEGCTMREFEISFRYIVNRNLAFHSN